MSKRTSVAEVANLSSAAAAAPVPEWTTEHFIDALAAASGPPFYTLTPQAARKVLSDSLAGADGKFTASKFLLRE
jgi:acetyl esterase